MKTQALILSTLLAAGLAPLAQAQQGVSLATGLTDFTTWTRYGSASAFNETPGNGFTYSDLLLTQGGLGGQAGAGFAPTALSIDFNQAFHFDFHFWIPISVDWRGDGLTFTLAGAPGIGSGGSGLAYEGLVGASVAFAIDTFHFDDEPVSPSLQILQSGSLTPLAATETGLGDTIRDPDFQWYAQVDYAPSGLEDQAGTLTGRIEHLNLGSFEVAATVDFSALGLAGNPVYYGFTASNGAATDAHWITSAVPVPEPQSWALWLAGMAALGALARRRRG
jgi:MYXO-CTERM domain-containing protein